MEQNGGSLNAARGRKSDRGANREGRAEDDVPVETAMRRQVLGCAIYFLAVLLAGSPIGEYVYRATFSGEEFHKRSSIRDLMLIMPMDCVA
jgi:hypothetical protein